MVLTLKSVFAAWASFQLVQRQIPQQFLLGKNAEAGCQVNWVIPGFGGKNIYENVSCTGTSVPPEQAATIIIPNGQRMEQYDGETYTSTGGSPIDDGPIYTNTGGDQIHPINTNIPGFAQADSIPDNTVFPMIEQNKNQYIQHTKIPEIPPLAQGEGEEMLTKIARAFTAGQGDGTAFIEALKSQFPTQDELSRLYDVVGQGFFLNRTHVKLDFSRLAEMGNRAHIAKGENPSITPEKIAITIMDNLQKMFGIE